MEKSERIKRNALILELYKQGFSNRKIANLVGLSKTAVHSIISKIIKSSTEEISVGKPKTWKPTMNLRWFEQVLGENVCVSYSAVKIKKLQQMWRSNIGNIEWRDITIETETEAEKN